jgi:hypothetical protein
MPLMKIYRLACDSPHCDSRIDRQSAKLARAKAKEEGWSRLKSPAGIMCDVCPRCTDGLLGGKPAAGGAA